MNQKNDLRAHCLGMALQSYTLTPRPNDNAQAPPPFNTEDVLSRAKAFLDFIEGEESKPKLTVIGGVK
jgi:hypothetical protein